MRRGGGNNSRVLKNMEIHPKKKTTKRKEKHEKESERVITFLCDKICME